ncbi:hypothetical protein [Halobaculum sp. P14]|uniref:hypothetical protein n=1 Tax=Halobaculum sp. P14 TaxID=3421638 RepID=UPI003EBC23C6
MADSARLRDRFARALPASSPRRVLAAVLLCGLVPWSIQVSPGSRAFLRFAWGGVSLDPVVARTLLTYLAYSSSPLLGRWVAAAACWLLAVGSAALGFVDAEDGRVTAGLLAVAGAANVVVASSFAASPAQRTYPVGSLLLWAVAAWRYRAARAARADA